MKAALLERFTDRIEPRLQTVERPRVRPGELILQVHACGVSPLDLVVCQGRIPGVNLPHVPGSEICGTVSEVGDGCPEELIAKVVVVCPWVACRRCEFCEVGRGTICRNLLIVGVHVWGGYASHVRVPASAVVPLPDNLKRGEGAAIAVSGLTAWHMLVSIGKLQVGETVLVMGASGGVGTLALQIASLSGARVFAVSGKADRWSDLCALGAERVFSPQTFVTEVHHYTCGRGVDMVIEHVGTSYLQQAVHCVAPGGRVVTCGATTGAMANVDVVDLFAREVSILGARGGSREELRSLLQEANHGRVRPVIQHTVTPDRLAEAHELIATRRVFGKVVIDWSAGS